MDKPKRDFSLLKAIRGVPQKNDKGEFPLYKANNKRRDANVRKFIDENVKTSNKSKNCNIMMQCLVLYSLELLILKKVNV